MTPKRPLLLPLTPVYAAGLALKNTLHNARVLPQRRLQKPVISIGSLSAGGAGKTPVVIMLAKLLQSHQHPVDVLTRGYGRSSRSAAHVPRGNAASATLYGDEPLEMMHADLEVFVGADRYSAGVLAEGTHQVQAHLLDDGFQHRQLARALDLVLLTADDLADHLLPAGNLREPLRSLRRADVVILREEASEQLIPIVHNVTQADIWTIRRSLEVEDRLTSPFVFCGIARPENFLAMLDANGREVAGHLIFPDHHRYTASDISRIVTAAKAARADGIYLTAKDAVKISADWLQRLQAVGPVHATRLHVELRDVPAALRTLERVLA